MARELGRRAQPKEWNGARAQAGARERGGVGTWAAAAAASAWTKMMRSSSEWIPPSPSSEVVVVAVEHRGEVGQRRGQSKRRFGRCPDPLPVGRCCVLPNSPYAETPKHTPNTPNQQPTTYDHNNYDNTSNKININTNATPSQQGWQKKAEKKRRSKKN